MKKAIRLLFLVVALVMVVCAFAGCAKTQPETPTDSDAPVKENTETAQEGSEAGEEASGEVAQIRFWEMMWGPAGQYEATVQKYCDLFNEEHPDIVVTPEFHTWDNYYQEYLTAVTGGMAPDVTNGAFNQSVQYAQMGELLDLSSVVEEWKADGTYDMLPAGSVELHYCNGIQAGLPWFQDPRLISYNTELFEEAGITELPTNWEEFLAACKAIKENTDAIPVSWAGGANHSSQILYMLMFQNGTGITDETGDVADFNSPEAIEALEFIGTMVEEGYVAPGTASYTDSDVWQLYNTEKLAIVMGTAPTYVTDEAMKAKTAIMPALSAKAGGEKATMTYVNPMVAYKSTKYPEACKTFISWWIKNAVPALCYEGGASGFPSYNYTHEKIASDPIYAQIIEKVLPYSKMPTFPSPYLYPGYSSIDGELILGKADQEVLTGNQDYSGVAEKYNAIVQEYLDDAK